MVKVSILTIGDEILIGQIVDTNSAWLAQQLNLNGFSVHEILSVSDDGDHIKQSLKHAEEISDIIITTGGLGPTADDITKPAIAEYFGGKLVINQEVLNDVTQYLTQKGRPLGKLNKNQALVPDNCETIRNHIGTAPVIWYNRNGKVFVSLPGVPFEMKELVKSKILPKLKATFNTPDIYHKTVMTYGLPESILAEKIADWENQLPDYMKLAYLPSPEAVRLRISARNREQLDIKQKVEQEITKLHQYIGKYIFGYNNEYLQQVIGKLLIERNATIATAESCTGGRIAHLITSVPGSSEYFKGSIVAYSNEAKTNLLNVPKEILEKYGAVSQQVVEAMAKGAVQTLNTNYAVATSGIAGPGGGTKEKPVGTVWIAAASKDKVVSKLYTININRDVNIRLSSTAALQLLRFLILGFV